MLTSGRASASGSEVDGMTAVAAEVPLVLDSVLEKLATDLGDHDGSMRRRFS